MWWPSAGLVSIPPVPTPTQVTITGGNQNTRSSVHIE